MNDTTSDPFGDAARKLTRLCIDGVEVNPREVSVDLSLTTDRLAARFGMEISSRVLLHELSEAGVQLESNGLEAFVRNDLSAHPKEAINGYLRIVQGIVCPPRRKRFFGLLSVPEPPVAWIIVQIEKVASKENRIFLSGIAIQGQAKSANRASP